VLVAAALRNARNFSPSAEKKNLIQSEASMSHYAVCKLSFQIPVSRLMKLHTVHAKDDPEQGKRKQDTKCRQVLQTTFGSDLTNKAVERPNCQQE